MTPDPRYLAGVRAGLEAAAKVAEAHKGSAARRRTMRGRVIRHHDAFIERTIQDEERGEDIASGMIATAIRAIDPTTVGGDHG